MKKNFVKKCHKGPPLSIWKIFFEKFFFHNFCYQNHFNERIFNFLKKKFFFQIFIRIPPYLQNLNFHKNSTVRLVHVLNEFAALSKDSASVWEADEARRLYRPVQADAHVQGESGRVWQCSRGRSAAHRRVQLGNQAGLLFLFQSGNTHDNHGALALKIK